MYKLRNKFWCVPLACLGALSGYPSDPGGRVTVILTLLQCGYPSPPVRTPQPPCEDTPNLMWGHPHRPVRTPQPPCEDTPTLMWGHPSPIILTPCNEGTTTLLWGHPLMWGYPNPPLRTPKPYIRGARLLLWIYHSFCYCKSVPLNLLTIKFCWFI